MFINGDIDQSNSKVRDDALQKYVVGIDNHNALVQTRINEIEDRGFAVYDDEGNQINEGAVPPLEDWEVFVPTIQFTKEDCVRSGVCRLNLELFEREGL